MHFIKLERSSCFSIAEDFFEHYFPDISIGTYTFSQLQPDEKAVIKEVLEGMLVKYETKR